MTIIGAYRHIDEAHVTRLLQELAGDVRAGVRFIRDFVAAWDWRVARLLDAAERQDPEDVMTVLLSVRSSSAMLGATGLTLAALDLQNELTQTRQVDRSAVLRFIDVGTAACTELTELARKLESTAV